MIDAHEASIKNAPIEILFLSIFSSRLLFFVDSLIKVDLATCSNFEDLSLAPLYAFLGQANVLLR